MSNLLTNNNVSNIITECKKLMSSGLAQNISNIDDLTKLIEKNLQMFSNSNIGRNGSSKRNDLMSRPIIMYLWHLIKQGKIVDVEAVDTTGASGKFLLIPMYDDAGKPTLQALMPIVANPINEPLGEYQEIRFVEKLSDFKVLEGKYMFRSSGSGIYIDECINDFEYEENLETCRSFDTVYQITTVDGSVYLENPLFTTGSIITINNELYHLIPNPHGSDELNDPNMKKASDGYITQDIIIPIIRGIGSPNKFIYSNGDDQDATAYRASIPVSRFMALGSLFVSHEKHEATLAKDPDNDLLKRKARVKEWDMIEGVGQALVEPYENMFPDEDKLKVLRLAIDMFIFTIIGTIAMHEGDNDARIIVLYTYFNLFGSKAEVALFSNPNTPNDVLRDTKGFKWLSYFVSLMSAWESVPYVNHKDLRRSHNVMYNLEFTSADFNDAHGTLVGAFASLPDGSSYTDVVTVPSRKRVNGEYLYSTKQMQVFKDHYGISAYILDDFDKYMLKCGATQFRGQFIGQLSSIAKYNRKQLNSQFPRHLVIAPKQVTMFRDFLEKQYGYGTPAYWKLV